MEQAMGNERSGSMNEDMEQAAAMGAVAQPPLRGEHVQINFDDFETPRAEMFGDTKSPAFTVNGKVVGANSVCVRQLEDVDYVEFAISQNRKLLLLVPCSEYVVQGYKWAREKDGKRYATTRTGVPFVLSICQMMGWDPNQRHRIPGKLINSEGIEMMSFDLTAAKHFNKPDAQKGISKSQVIFTGDWDGHFGPKFSESRRTLQVDKFDELTVWSIKGGETNEAYHLAEGSVQPDGIVTEEAASQNAQENSTVAGDESTPPVNVGDSGAIEEQSPETVSDDNYQAEDPQIDNHKAEDQQTENHKAEDQQAENPQAEGHSYEYAGGLTAQTAMADFLSPPDTGGETSGGREDDGDGNGGQG